MHLVPITSQISDLAPHVTILRKTMYHDIVSRADICFSTCLGFGSRITSTVDFPIVLVDEATQCDLPQSLIPLLKDCRQLCLVGDHKQLEPVACNEVVKAGYNVSMFEYHIKGESTYNLVKSALVMCCL